MKAEYKHEELTTDYRWADFFIPQRSTSLDIHTCKLYFSNPYKEKNHEQCGPYVLQGVADASVFQTC